MGLFGVLGTFFSDCAHMTYSDVNAKDQFGDTPLIHEAELGQIEGVKEILDRGADINSQGSYGGTALYWAANGRQKDMVVFLIQRGAKIDIKNEEGKTALMFISGREEIDKDDVEIAKLLIENGAQVNTKDHYQNTPLIDAVLKGHFEMVKLLVENGANIYYRDERGKTALELAKEKQYQEIVDYLEKRPVNVVDQMKAKASYIINEAEEAVGAAVVGGWLSIAGMGSKIR